MGSEKPLIALFIIAFALIIGGSYLGCRNDLRASAMREECHAKGGVWYQPERLCLDLKTIPLKEP